MINTFWLGLKEWVWASYHVHPTYTCVFGAGCFVLGYLLG